MEKKIERREENEGGSVRKIERVSVRGCEMARKRESANVRVLRR